MTNKKYNQWLMKEHNFNTSAANSDNYLRVCFQLGNVCTNNCVYCPPGCKDGTYPWPTYEQAARIINKIDQVYKSAPYNKKKIQFELLGGEVTLWKDIEKIIELIHSLGNDVDLVTNGVRTVRWWAEYGKYFSHVTLSFHPEFAEKEHATEVLNTLTDNNVGAGTLVLMLPSHWDKCLETIEYMTAHGKWEVGRIRSLTLIGHMGQHDRWPYTDDQWSWLEKNNSFYPVNGKKVQYKEGPHWQVPVWRNSETDEILREDFETVISNKRNNWYGWDCYVGIDTLYLEQNGDIRRDAMCYVAPQLGNWKKGNLDNITWPYEPIKCKFLSCFCTHDMKARKIKI